MTKFLGIFLLLLLLAGGAVGAGVLWLRRAEREALYHPSPALAATPAEHHLRYQTVIFRAADGPRLRGWWIPCRNARGTVLYCHGGNGNRADDAQWVPFFAGHRMNVLLWDYRGYGDSEGVPSESGFHRDARSAFDAAAESSHGLPILVYGHALGAAVAARLAHERPVAGLVLEGAFASAADMARRLHPAWPVAPFLSVEYDTAASTAALPGIPKLIGHNPSDPTVPFQSGRTLHAAAAAPKAFVLLDGEHSWFRDGAPGNAELAEFLSRCAAAPTSAAAP